MNETNRPTVSAVIGIDPGLSGGIAIIRNHQIIEAAPLPSTGDDIDTRSLINWINRVIMYDPFIGGLTTIAYIEKVHSMPEQGVASVFKFGFVTGKVHGIIETLGIPLKLVTPQAWKKEILSGTKKDKVAAVDYCLSAFPDVSLFASERSKKYHSGIADALCIAEYGYRKEVFT